MAKSRAFVAYDEQGRVTSVSRPTENDQIKVVVLSAGGAVLETELDPEEIESDFHSYSVDVSKRALITPSTHFAD